MIRSEVATVSGAEVAAADLTQPVAIERELASFADSIPQLVWASDPHGEATHVNERWVRYTGMPFAAARGNGWNAVLHPDDAADVQRLWELAAATGTFEGSRPVPAPPPRRRVPLVRHPRGRRARRTRRDRAVVRNGDGRRRPVPRRAAARDPRPARRRVHGVARVRADGAHRRFGDVRRFRRLRVRRRRERRAAGSNASPSRADASATCRARSKRSRRRPKRRTIRSTSCCAAGARRSFRPVTMRGCARRRGATRTSRSPARFRSRRSPTCR